MDVNIVHVQPLRSPPPPFGAAGEKPSTTCFKVSRAVRTLEDPFTSNSLVEDGTYDARLGVVSVLDSM